MNGLGRKHDDHRATSNQFTRRRIVYQMLGRRHPSGVLLVKTMAARYSRYFALTAPLARYHEERAALGAHASAGEMIRTVLMLLRERDRSAQYLLQGQNSVLQPTTRNA